MFDSNFEYGEQVRVIRNIRNDAHNQSNFKKGELLIRRGSTGYIRQTGVYQQDQVIHQVHFLEDNLIVGCRESELIEAKAPWLQNTFEYGDTPTLVIALAIAGKVIAKKGDKVQVISVDRSSVEAAESTVVGNNSKPIFEYRIQVGEFDVTVPQSALVR